MISCNLYGGLGNQLFMAAATIAHALSVKKGYAFPKQTINARIWPNMLPASLPRLMLHSAQPQYDEPNFFYEEIPKDLTNIRLNGYFQSYKYFEDYEDEIRTEFGFAAGAGFDAVSIHVRRGDYLTYADKHPSPPLHYFQQAIEQFGDSQFMVFSDDIQWCHKNFKGDRFYFSDSKDPWADLRAMALCRDNIISNSTFSWWGAWLNNNDEKIVVTPDEQNWFGPGNKHLDVKDLIPETWTRIHY